MLLWVWKAQGNVLMLVLWIPIKKSLGYWTQIGFQFLSDSNISFIPSYRNKSPYIPQQTQIKCNGNTPYFRLKNINKGYCGSLSWLIQSHAHLFFSPQFINSLTYSANVHCGASACSMWKRQTGFDFKSLTVRWWQKFEQTILTQYDPWGEHSQSYGTTDRGNSGDLGN